jgi:hypothetical protein
MNLATSFCVLGTKQARDRISLILPVARYAMDQDRPIFRGRDDGSDGASSAIAGRRGPLATTGSSSVLLDVALSAALIGCVPPSSPEGAINDDIAAARNVGSGTLSPGESLRDEPFDAYPWKDN